MRENLLKEKHSGGLAGNFGHDKTFTQLMLVVEPDYLPDSEVLAFSRVYTP
jgi:hypothetical protein